MITFIMLYNVVKSQTHGGFEQYYYTGAGVSTVVPKVYYESRSKWYSEVRYNYEELQTVSFNSGKIFSNKKLLSYTITPFAGIVLGKLNGGTLGSNIKMEYKSLFFSAESQYTFSVEKKAENFFFNWSELGYQLTSLMYAGFALQLTHPYELRNNWEAGVMIGFTYKSWTFPVYVFDPAGNKINFVLGINWEWTHTKSGNTK
ncbi:MAG: hypothetical protein ABI863_04780 [Ginsengibacter sp.]